MYEPTHNGSLELVVASTKTLEPAKPCCAEPLYPEPSMLRRTMMGPSQRPPPWQPAIWPACPPCWSMAPAASAIALSRLWPLSPAGDTQVPDSGPLSIRARVMLSCLSSCPKSQQAILEVTCGCQTRGACSAGRSLVNCSVACTCMRTVWSLGLAWQVPSKGAIAYLHRTPIAWPQAIRPCRVYALVVSRRMLGHAI